jgi:hypothetical protein
VVLGDGVRDEPEVVARGRQRDAEVRDEIDAIAERAAVLPAELERGEAGLLVDRVDEHVLAGVVGGQERAAHADRAVRAEAALVQVLAVQVEARREPAGRVVAGAEHEGEVGAGRRGTGRAVERREQDRVRGVSRGGAGGEGDE